MNAILNESANSSYIIFINKLLHIKKKEEILLLTQVFNIIFDNKYHIE